MLHQLVGLNGPCTYVYVSARRPLCVSLVYLLSSPSLSALPSVRRSLTRLPFSPFPNSGLLLRVRSPPRALFSMLPCSSVRSCRLKEERKKEHRECRVLISIIHSRSRRQPEKVGNVVFPSLETRVVTVRCSASGFYISRNGNERKKNLIGQSHTFLGQAS